MLVDEATGDEKWEVKAHCSEWDRDRIGVTLAAMSPSGRFVASVCCDHSAWGTPPAPTHWKLLDAASGDVHMVGITHDGTHPSCICTELDEDDDRVLQEGCPVVAHTEVLHSLAFSPCGQRLATGSEDCAVILWDAQTGEAERRLQGASRQRVQIYSLSFSADGARLASSSGDRVSGDAAILMWDVTTGALLRTTPGRPSRLQFSPTEFFLLASTGGSKIFLWDVDSGKILSGFRRCRQLAGRQFAVFSPDGRTIATRCATRAGEVLLVDAESGTERVRMVDQEATVLCASFGVNPKP